MNEKDLWNRYKNSLSGDVSQCPDTNDLAAYIDGGLDPESRESIEAHLNRCPECLDAILEIGSLKQEFGLPASTDFPDDRRKIPIANNIPEKFTLLRFAASVVFLLLSVGGYVAGESVCETSEKTAVKFLENDLQPLAEIMDRSEKLFYFDTGVIL